MPWASRHYRNKGIGKEKDIIKILLIIYLLWNVITLVVMGVDKRRAKMSRRRVPEKRLFIMALAMGALGIHLGMKLFRHKTQHKSFIVGIPVLFFVNVGIGFYFWLTMN